MGRGVNVNHANAGALLFGRRRFGTPTINANASAQHELLAEKRAYQAAGGTVSTDAEGTTTWISPAGLHRVGGPALESADGSTEWWFCGKLHRESGPAIERADGTCKWYWHGGRIPQPGTEYGHTAE